MNLLVANLLMLVFLCVSLFIVFLLFLFDCLLVCHFHRRIKFIVVICVCITADVGGESSVAGAKNWQQKNHKAYGISMSLYDQHPITGKISGVSLRCVSQVCLSGVSLRGVSRVCLSGVSVSGVSLRCVSRVSLRGVSRVCFVCVCSRFLPRCMECQHGLATRILSVCLCQTRDL